MTYLLDNFESRQSASFGSSWVAQNDQPMGGHSRIEITHCQQADHYLEIKGQVKNEPPAGYIEAALPLIRARHLFDARLFEGVYVRTQSGLPPSETDHYFIRLQTRELSMPWQFYQAPFSPPAELTGIKIPFINFQAVNTSHTLNLERLTRISVTASNGDFTVDLKLSEIGFY